MGRIGRSFQLVAQSCKVLLQDKELMVLPLVSGWAVVAATVGTLLRVIHDRVGFLGRIVTTFIGAAWSLATFFVVPVLVLEDRSVRDSFTRSLGIFRQTWGETFVGGVSLGLLANAFVAKKS